MRLPGICYAVGENYRKLCIKLSIFTYTKVLFLPIYI